MRSQINLNPLNPKRHSDQAIKLQKKNMLKVGFLGGIVWNRVTGNLIDGHRRIYAMDLYYGYDGTSNDYEVKVEVVELSAATEREQLTYMAVGNTKPDYDLIAKYIKDIDSHSYSDLGLSDNELKDILSMADVSASRVMDDALGDFITPFDRIPNYAAGNKADDDPSLNSEEDSIDAEAKKEHVKAIKEKTQRLADERQREENAFVVLSFSTADAKTAFMDVVGCAPDTRFVKGEEVLKLIE